MGNVVAEYFYTDSDGSVLFKKQRIEPGKNGSKKDFCILRATESGYEYGLLPTTPRPLYNLPAVLKAKEIAILAGEKDAETAISMGMVGTTNCDGENQKWIDSEGKRAEWIEPLKGKHVIFFPDQDKVGREHEEKVILALQGFVSSLAIVHVPLGKDLTDYMQSDGVTTSDLNKLVEIAKLPSNAPLKRLGELIRKRGDPAALESEKVILGALMTCRTPIGEVDHILPEMFFSQAHRVVFEACSALSKDGSCDRAAVIQYLQQHEKLEEVGGISALLDMTEELLSTYNIEYHTDKVIKKAEDRVLLKELVSSAQSLIVGNDASEVRSRVVEAAGSVVINPGKLLQTMTISQITGGNLKEFLKPKTRGLMCKPLDPILNECYGFHQGQLVIIGARPSIGKSSLLMELMAYFAGPGKAAVEIISLEVSSEEVVNKMVCQLAKIPYLEVVAGKMTEAQYARFESKYNQLSKCNIRISDRNDWNISKLRNHLKKRRSAGDPVRVLGIDYLQLLSTSMGMSGRKDLDLGEITRGLKILSKEFGLTTILLSQLSRRCEQEGRKPNLSDLRDSGSIEADADIVWLLSQDKENDTDKDPERNAEINAAKVRNGRTGAHKVRWCKPFTMFFSPNTIPDIDYDAMYE